MDNSPKTPYENPPLTVAILNWNGASLLAKFLPSVLAFSPREKASILVIDNGSTDHSLEMLAKDFPEVEVLSFDTNRGFAGGYNKALQEIATPYVCLLNSDVEVTKGWIDSPLELLQKDPSLGAVQPKILSYKAKEYFEYAGAAGGFLDREGYPFCAGRIFTTLEKDRGQYNTLRQITWASGAALFVRKEAFMDVGGFDPLFFSHMEEIDLAWRLQRAGYSLCYSPFSVVYHVGGATLSAGNPKKTYYNYRNNLLMLYKNLPLRDSMKILRRRKVLDTLASIQFLLKGQVAHFKAVQEARRDFHKMKVHYNPPLEGSFFPPLEPYSILWHYFICRHTTFEKLPKNKENI